MCKRKVNFDSLEEIRDNKKFKVTALNNSTFILAEPEDQAHREP